MIVVTTNVRFPLWIFMQTQKVAAAAAFVVTWPCCVSFNNNNCTEMFNYTANYLTALPLFTLSYVRIMILENRDIVKVVAMRLEDEENVN